MNVIEAIKTRRAVRAFTPRVVEEASVRALLTAAVQAPSATNAQPWAFAVIQNTDQLKRYSERGKRILLEQFEGDPKAQRYRALLGDESFNIFYDASTLVAIGVTSRTIYSDADCWLAAQNLMLAATDAGLGTCCLGFAVPVLNTPDVKAELGFGSAGAVIAPVIVGYPSTSLAPVSRQEPRVVYWSR